jgi:hypothetical protein
MASIFVSIANYKDPEAPETVKSLLANQSGGNDIRIVVLTQGEPAEFPEDARVQQIVVDPWQSEGACWARHVIQTQYLGEDYHLQIDSHTQFAPGWDTMMLEDHALGGPKSIITTYLSGYEFVDAGDPTPEGGFRHDERRITRWPRPSALDVHDRDGLPSATPYFIDTKEELTETLYYSGHWAFSSGRLIVDVPYDPGLFFHGEEITYAIRAYCAGYNLYVPRRWVASTLHQRTTRECGPRKMFWDSEEDAQRDIKWWQRDVMAKIKGQAICNGKWWGRYGIQDEGRFDEMCQKMKDWFSVDLRAIVYK